MSRLQTTVAMSRKLLRNGCIACVLFAVAPARADDCCSAYDWTGLFVGFNVGGGWGAQDPLNILTSTARGPSFDFSGALIGATAGAQIQKGHVVLGLIGDFDWAPMSTNGSLDTHVEGDAPSVTNVSLQVRFLATARIRVGYALDNWLIYATGGLAGIGARTELTEVAGVVCGEQEILKCHGPNWRIGGSLGGGVEFGFTPQLSVSVEYLRAGGIAFERASMNAVRAGVVFRFGN